jgi:NTP pyrophosphatase (non-canonical NTP hydrolase)
MSQDNAPLTIAAAQKAVDDWISQFPAGYWPPLSNLARLVEEVGELARELNHRHGHKPKKSDEPEQDLSLELADILFVLIALANQQGIDLDDALRRTLAKYATRDATRWTSSEQEAQDDDDDRNDEDPPRRRP